MSEVIYGKFNHDLLVMEQLLAQARHLAERNSFDLLGYLLGMAECEVSDLLEKAAKENETSQGQKR